MERHRVAISGLGVVSAVGNTVSDFFDALVHGRSGVRRLPWREDTVAASVDWREESHFPRAQLNMLDRFSQFALVAAQQAVEQARLSPALLATPRAAVYFGSGLGGAQTMDSGYHSYLSPSGRVPPTLVVLTMANAAAAHISLRHGIRGPCLTYSIACASAAVAIGEAFRAIRDGYVDLAIAGGSEALLAPGIVAGWNAMRVLAPPAADPAKSCRPFALDRRGLVLGEGAAAFLLESEAHLKARDGAPLAILAGYGTASDAAHLAKPDAGGQALAMRAALAEAGMSPGDIGYINAHGTATPVGDPVETASIKEVFGDLARGVPISSTKALHGHLLGASGAVELVAAVMAVREGMVPPTCHLDAADPECDLDYVPNLARRAPALRSALSNSFAFGGTNASLVVTRAA
jgi:3-oxoacyl-[acyl-carrier-protein] synthase II